MRLDSAMGRASYHACLLTNHDHADACFMALRPGRRYLADRAPISIVFTIDRVLDVMTNASAYRQCGKRRLPDPDESIAGPWLSGGAEFPAWQRGVSRRDA